MTTAKQLALPSLVALVLSSLVVLARADSDTEITRVRPLSDEEKRAPAPRDERTRSVYLVNLVPVGRSYPGFGGGGNELEGKVYGGSGPFPKDPRGRNPTLFLLQKVEEGGDKRLPDGIYYRPESEGEEEEPKTAFVKDLTDVQSYILARAPFRSPGRQNTNRQ